jgi:cytochrome c553
MKTEFLYMFFHRLGYDHPLHAAFTHMPTGLVVGAFIFLITALALKRYQILTTSYHCIILALIFLFPTAFFGYTDWQHFYKGVWLFPIKMKMTLAGALLIFLVAAIVMEKKKIGGLMGKSAIYFFCVAAVVGLGYFGAQLVFPDTSPALSSDVQAGENLYATQCARCHPNGSNIINSAIPVMGSTQLKNPNTFTRFIRNPLRPDGSKGIMPAFPKEKLSDDELRQIYQYITRGLARK